MLKVEERFFRIIYLQKKEIQVSDFSCLETRWLYPEKDISSSPSMVSRPLRIMRISSMPPKM